ncbi:MAG: hypothetical protein CSB44_06080, partial [Gammaproteobacteria bacterium]
MKLSWIPVVSRKRDLSAERGSLGELAFAVPVLLVLGLSTLQGSLIHHGRSTLNYATFEAARTGATNNARVDSMRQELALRLARREGRRGHRALETHDRGFVANTYPDHQPDRRSLRRLGRQRHRHRQAGHPQRPSASPVERHRHAFGCDAA